MNIAGPAWRRSTPEELRLLADDRLPGRDRRRAGAAGRREHPAGAGRGAHPDRPRDPRHAGAGPDRDRAGHRGGAAPPGEQPGAGPRAAGAGAGDHPREPGGGAPLGARPAGRAAGWPAAGRGAGCARRARSPPRRACGSTSRPSDGVGLPLRAEAELYRIAQEALANVRQHAHAHRGRGRAARDADGRRCSRSGTTASGSAPGRGRRGTSRASSGMRERARLLGGRLRIASRAGRGTTISGAGAAARSEAEPRDPRRSWSTTTRSCARGWSPRSRTRPTSRSSARPGSAEEALRLVGATAAGRLLLDLELPGHGRRRGDPAPARRPARRRGSWSSPPTTPTSACWARSGPARSGYLLKGATVAEIARRDPDRRGRRARRWSRAWPRS